MQPSPTPRPAHPCAPLALIPLIAGLVAWMFTGDWRWAVAGAAGTVTGALLVAALSAHQAARESSERSPWIDR